MIKLYSITLFICLAVSAVAQQNFQPGYILTDIKSDTTFGQIDYQNWENNPKEIRFQKNNNQILTIVTSEISAFGISNEEHYQTKRTSLDITPNQEGRLLLSPNRTITEDTLISLLVLVSGENSLYFFKDKSDKEHFFLEKQNKITELVNHRYLIEQNSKLYIRELPLYRAQLKSLFSDCSKEVKVEGISFVKKSLTKKLIEYNECVGCTYLCYYEKKKDASSISLGLIFAYNSENKNFVHIDYLPDIRQRYTLKSQGLTYGINAEFVMPRSLNRNRIYFEAYYIQEKIDTELKDYLQKLNSINLTTLYRRSLANTNEIKPYYGIGLGLKYLLTPRDEHIFNPLEVITPQLLLELGIKRKNLGAYARLKSYPFPTSDYEYLYKRVAEVYDKFTYKKLQFQFGLNYFLINKTN